MEKRKKIIISILFVLLTIIITAGISYAAFVFITNSGIVEANSGKLDIAYNIEDSSVSGILIPSATKSGGISTSVTAKINSGSVDAGINLYLTPTAITGLPITAIKWEVDVVNTSGVVVNTYSGDLSTSIMNTPYRILEAYPLSSNLLTFNIYIWLNGSLVTNENFDSDNSFSAVISADSIAITGEFSS